jgi:uncharacterized membrane protein YbhN (UPF0104 family)
MDGLKRHAATALRIALALGLLAVLATQVTWTDQPAADGKPAKPGLLGILSGLSPAWAVAAAVGTLIPNILVGVRWWVLMNARKLGVGPAAAVKLNLVGTFFNNIALGAGGGDLVKAYQVTAHAPGRRTEAIVTIFLDRFLALMALGSVAAVFILRRLNDPDGDPDELNRVRGAGVGVMMLLAGGLTAAAFFTSRRLRRAAWFEAVLSRLPMSDIVRRLDNTVHLYRHSKKAVLLALALAWVGQFIAIAATYAAGRAVGLDRAGFDAFLWVVPVIWVMAAVPLTPGAVGVMEFGFVWFHTSLGCGDSHALALALVVRVMNAVSGLPGAIILLSGAYKPPPDGAVVEPASEPVLSSGDSSRSLMAAAPPGQT